MRILDGNCEYGHQFRVFGSVLPLIDDQRSLLKVLAFQCNLKFVAVLFLMEFEEYGHHLTVFGSALPLIDDQRSLLKVLAFQSIPKFVARACYS